MHLFIYFLAGSTVLLILPQEPTAAGWLRENCALAGSAGQGPATEGNKGQGILGPITGLQMKGGGSDSTSCIKRLSLTLGGEPGLLHSHSRFTQLRASVRPTLGIPEGCRCGHRVRQTVGRACHVTLPLCQVGRSAELQKGRRGGPAEPPTHTPAQPGQLTYLNGCLSPQEQFEALGVVGQAAVVQGRAALACLFIQVPAARNTDRKR